jgi:hypothetical protein
MKSITIFRIEHSIIKHNDLIFMGPYEGAVACKDWADSSSNFHGDSAHPTWYDDLTLISKIPKNIDCTSYYCGFSNQNDLFQWFSKEELKKLNKLGFVIVSYKTENYFKGINQLIFIPKGKRKVLNKLTVKL